MGKYITNTYQITNNYQNIFIDAKDAKVSIETSDDINTKLIIYEKKKHPYHYLIQDNELIIKPVQTKFFNLIRVGIDHSEIKLSIPKSNYENIKVAHRYAMKISMIFAFIVAILTNVFAGDIASVFASSGSSVRIAGELTSFLQWIVIYYPTMAVGVASTYVFQGVGKGITAMFQTIMRETGFTIFFAVLFGVVFNFGVWGAWMGIVLGEIVSNNITLVWAYLYIKKLIKSGSEHH